MVKKIIRKIIYSDRVRNCGNALFRLCPSLAVTYCYLTDGRREARNSKREFAAGTILPDGASRADYDQMLKSHKMSLNEYLNIYHIPGKTEQERREFLSKVEMNALSLKLRMMFPEYDHAELYKDKARFLAYCSSHGMCHRRWLYAPEASFSEFADLVGATDCMMKPHDSSYGSGIFKVKRQTGDGVKALYERCVREHILVEECIRGCEELQAFHPASLNTLRFVTVGYNGQSRLVGSIVRMGQGGIVVDNTAAGGIYAGIDIDNGIIDTEGITLSGAPLSVHPDSGITIKGYPIPHWDEAVKQVLAAASQIKNIITGWDVAITDEGRIEFVEANSRPDPEGMQAPHQQGIRSRLLGMLSELTGQRITL